MLGDHRAIRSDWRTFAWSARVSRQPATTSSTSPNARNSPVARFAWTPKRPGAEISPACSRSSASRSPASRCLRAWCCATCAAPPRPSRRAKTRLRHLALHDPLCGLPNRIYLRRAAGSDHRRGQAGRRRGRGVLHRPRPFQGRQRHARPPGRRRTDPQCDPAAAPTCAAEDLVARLGGDEFAVITSVAADTRAARHRRRALSRRLCAPYSIDGHTIVIGASDRHRRDRPARRAARPTSCATPTWRSTAPRTKAATAPASTTRRWMPICRKRKLIEHDLREAIEQRRARRRLPADRQRQRRKGGRRRGAGALDASRARADIRRPTSSRSPSTPA